MKKLFLYLTFFVFAFTVAAQTRLTFMTNAPRNGDAPKYYAFDYVDPGVAGGGQNWDFAKIVFNGKEIISNVGIEPAAPLMDAVNYNSVTGEDGYEYYNKINENGVELKGYTTKDISLIYTDPITKMKYPFAYGDSYVDFFAGEAHYLIVRGITFEGKYQVSADAYGTLRMPDKTIKNALRVKVVKTAVEYNPCSTIDLTHTLYYWFADGYRYPLVMMSHKEYQRSYEKVPNIETLAYYSPQEAQTAEENALGTMEYTAADFALNTYPNPFAGMTSCTYFLRKSMDVTAELYDITGKTIAVMVNNQKQEEGVHSLDIDGAELGLVPGVYYIKFTFDKKEVVQKIVKIQS
ncbi:MAG TPA: T9SS type A sorting domain-containing protein [Bacteroidales bacterium]|nr:T9SS type A sorting domain-containing protein [Bacteroidales bacterium]